jgi:hypothetical protein
MRTRKDIENCSFHSGYIDDSGFEAILEVQLDIRQLLARLINLNIIADDLELQKIAFEKFDSLTNSGDKE